MAALGIAYSPGMAARAAQRNYLRESIKQ